MGQYFKCVNTDKKEVLTPPGGMKAIERVTNSVTTGLLAYLLLEGPQDGTAFTGRADPEDPALQEGIAEYIEREVAREDETGRESMMRDDDGDWKRQRIAGVVAAGRTIAEANEFAGRWAGDRVTMIGDYAERDLYDETSENWHYELARRWTIEGTDLDSETVSNTRREFTNYATTACPIVPGSITQPDIVHSTRKYEGQHPEEGSLAHVRHPDLEEKVYAHFQGVAENEFTNITDDAMAEFVDFVGEDWVESQCGGLLRPDMVLQA